MEPVLAGIISTIERYGKYHPQQQLTQAQVAEEFNISPNAVKTTLSRWKNPKHFDPALPYVEGGTEHTYIWKDLIEFRDRHLRRQKRKANSLTPTR